MAALAVGACASDPVASRSLASDAVPPELAALRVTLVKLGGLELRVAVADTPATRSRGLMGVKEFGGADGMLFVFEAPTATGFHMRNVPVPLDIAFIGADGKVVAVLTMPVCTAEPCPMHHSPAPFQWAVETPSGTLDGILPGDAFSIR